ncbi:STAS domain-containing protein [Actinoplanes sp. CA-030573]|uniref:STAS domain-containing protein n=1 Tax=Actinoplanes sp. CA-030573 TaxID=3239898 RepID=UPI003D94AD4C
MRLRYGWPANSTGTTATWSPQPSIRPWTPGHHRIFLDLSALTFLDAAVVGELVRCHAHTTEHEETLRLDAVHGLPARVLDITGTRALLCETGPATPARLPPRGRHLQAGDAAAVRRRSASLIAAAHKLMQRSQLLRDDSQQRPL